MFKLLLLFAAVVSIVVYQAIENTTLPTIIFSSIAITLFLLAIIFFSMKTSKLKILEFPIQDIHNPKQICGMVILQLPSNWSHYQHHQLKSSDLLYNTQKFVILTDNTEKSLSTQFPNHPNMNMNLPDHQTEHLSEIKGFWFSYGETVYNLKARLDR